MNSLTPTQSAYIAGIIDGEGTITLTTHKKGCFPSPAITVASSDYELLLWLKNTLQAGQIVNKKNYKPAKHKKSWTFSLKHNNAIQLLKLIEPYLLINKKRKRCSLIIDEYKKLTPRNGRYSKELLQMKNDFYEKFMNY